MHRRQTIAAAQGNRDLPRSIGFRNLHGSSPAAGSIHDKGIDCRRTVICRRCRDIAGRGFQCTAIQHERIPVGRLYIAKGTAMPCAGRDAAHANIQRARAADLCVQGHGCPGKL